MEYIWIVLAVPMICLLLISSIIYILRKRYKLGCILSVAAIALNWWTESIPLNFLNPSKDSKSFSVMTYNLHDPGGWFEDHMHDPSEMANLILTQDADIVVLEECDNKRAEKLADYLSVKYHYQQMMLWNYHNAIFCKYPIDSFSELELKNDSPVYDDHPNIVSDSVRNRYSRRHVFYVDVKLPRHTIKVIGCHFASNLIGHSYNLSAVIENMQRGGTLREIEAYCVRNAVDSCRTVGIPTIVCGDLNDFCGSKTLHILQKYGALKDCWWERGSGFGFTFHSQGWMHFRLDHILHTEDLECTSVKVVKQDYSDHNALIANFEFE